MPRVFIDATGGTLVGTQAKVEQHGYTVGQLKEAVRQAGLPVRL